MEGSRGLCRNGHRWDGKRFNEVEFPQQRVPWIYSNGCNRDIALRGTSNIDCKFHGRVFHLQITDP